MNNQEIFNIVWERAKDHRVCKDKNWCKYRQNDNANDELRCFIGACIPDEKYSPGFEDSSLSQVLSDLKFTCDLTFAEQLQEIHDLNKPENWERMLRNLAQRFKLTVPQ